MTRHNTLMELPKYATSKYLQEHVEKKKKNYLQKKEIKQREIVFFFTGFQ
jgi:hypothetical protein